MVASAITSVEPVDLLRVPGQDPPMERSWTPGLAVCLSLAWILAVASGSGLAIIVVGASVIAALIAGTSSTRLRSRGRRLSSLAIAGTIGTGLVLVDRIDAPHGGVMLAILATAFVAVGAVPMIYAATRPQSEENREPPA